MEEHSDEQLVQDYISGDGKVFEEIVRRYMETIYRFAFGYVGSRPEAEDITQETFVKVWKNIKKFDRKRRFKTWIFEIAKNTSIDFCRRRKITPFSSFEDEAGRNKLESSLSDAASPGEEYFEEADFKEKASAMVDRLPERDRRIVRLRIDNDYTFEEISKITKEPMNTVKSIYRRAVLKLQKINKNAPK